MNTALDIRNQWGDRTQNFEVLHALRDWQTYNGSITPVRTTRAGEMFEQGNQLCLPERTTPK